MRKPLDHLNGMTNSTSFGGASLFGAGNTLGAPMMHTSNNNNNDTLESDRPSSNHLMSNGRLSPQSNHNESRPSPSVNHGRLSPSIHHSQSPAMDNLGGKSPNGYGEGRKSPVCKEKDHISPMVNSPMKVQEEGRKSIDDSWVSLGWSDLQASGETLPTDNEPSHPLASIPEMESKPPASPSFLSAEPTSMNMNNSPVPLERGQPKSSDNASLKGLSGSPMREDKPETMREKSPIRFASMETKSMTPQKEPAMPILPPTIMQTPTTKAIEESSKATPKEKTPAAVPKATPKEQTPKSTGSPVTPRSSGRQRKSVNRLSPVPQERVESKTIEIPTGSGAKLGDISHVAKELAKHKSDYPAILTLHRVIFGRPGEASKRKAHLRLFNGLSSDADVSKIAEKLAHHTLDELRDICVFLNLDRSGEKKALSERIVEFLTMPADLGESKPVPRRTPQKRGTSSPKSGGRRKMSKTASGTELHLEDEMELDQGQEEFGQSVSGSDSDEQVMAELAQGKE